METSATYEHKSMPFTLRDVGFFLLILALSIFSWRHWSAYMDVYEKGILVLTPLALGWLCWYWRALQPYLLVVLALVALGVLVYADNYDNQNTALLLKYFLSSQSAIILMCFTSVASCIVYWMAFVEKFKNLSRLGTIFLWLTAIFALVAMMMRWYESYLVLGAGQGHIPVSNLYEVMILFILLASLYYLYYEQKLQTNRLGAFVGLVNVAAVGFLVWYAIERNGHDIQPLVPALKSWWMKLHVPANFIGYGTFAIAAMAGFAYLIKKSDAAISVLHILTLLLLGIAVLVAPVLLRTGIDSGFWMKYLGVSVLLLGVILYFRTQIASKLPSLEVLEEVMYRTIAVGFAFFTVATVLGAAWADEAWGAAWSWDPKEIWALIVWLNYAAWLHMRMIVKSQQRSFLAIWAIIGIFITAFAFWGVNMFLSGLHSYGSI